ncbi:DUF4212 domain-containing protein [Ottowia sp. VDI28]|uniref:DUF4212 domain-containing protein n=1 Tax=Ottowia sp. VDI28 TaxID=3133968 RepID=UPI003C2E67D0
MDPARELGKTTAESRSFDGLRVLLLVVWAVASFGVSWFARDLQQVVAGWPFNFWFAAQGAVLVFLGIVVVYAIVKNREERKRAGAANER